VCVCVCVCASTIRDGLSLADGDDYNPVTSAVVSPYLPLTPDNAMSSVNSPVSLSASDVKRHGSSVNSLSSVGVDDKCRQTSSSLGHARHRSVDFALADIIPDLSETIDTDFLHAARSLSYCVNTLILLVFYLFM